jgi:hypothetical protein
MPQMYVSMEIVVITSWLFNYSNVNTHTVACCDLHGTTQWEFKDNRVLHHRYDISVDNDGNVYVVGHVSSNVVIDIEIFDGYYKELNEVDVLVKM